MTWKRPTHHGERYRVYIVDDVGAKYGETVCAHPELGAIVQKLADDWYEQIYHRGHQVKVDPVHAEE